MNDDPIKKPSVTSESPESALTPPLVAYANNIGVRAGAIDLAVQFGFQPGSNETIEPLARIVMAWEEAAVLRDFLSDSLARYEEGIGAVRNLRDDSVEVDEDDSEGIEEDLKAATEEQESDD